MRRLVVAVVVAVLALSLSACSSSPPAATPAATPAPAAPAAAPVVAGRPGAAPGIANRSTNETITFAPFPTGADVPPDLAQKISVDKQPTLILFYNSTSYTSKEVRKIIDAVRTRNRGVVDLVAYDIGKYTDVAPDASISVQSGLASDTVSKQAVLFARDPAISVTMTPFIVLTDGQGFIIYKHFGFIDQAFLEREVLRAAR